MGIEKQKHKNIYNIVVVKLPSHVWLFATPWTAACQAPLSFTIPWSLLRFMSIESVMLLNYLIICHPLLLLPSIFPNILHWWVLILMGFRHLWESYEPMETMPRRIHMHGDTCHMQHSKDLWNALSPSVDSRLRTLAVFLRTPTTVHEFSWPLTFIALHF